MKYKLRLETKPEKSNQNSLFLTICIFGGIFLGIIYFSFFAGQLKDFRPEEFGLSRAHRVINQLQAGICWINSWGDSPAEMPVGGYKESGIGRENGPETLKSYTQIKSIFVRLDDLENPY